MPGRKKSNTLASRIVIIQTMFYVNTVIWFCFSVYTVIDMLSQSNGVSSLLAGFFILSNAGAMFVSAKILSEKESWAYFFALFTLIFNSLVTRIGQFGFFDPLALLFNLIILGSLILIGKNYLKKS